MSDGGGVETYENVSLVSSNVSVNPHFGTGALDANSKVQDRLELVNSTPLPSNLSIVDSQDLEIGGFSFETTRLVLLQPESRCKTMDTLTEVSGEAMRLAILFLALSQMALPQQTTVTAADPLQQQLAGLSLNDQDIMDGVAMLSHTVSFAVSVEHPLGATISKPAPPLKALTIDVGPGSIAQILDQLCASDPTFTWMRNRNMVNVLPRALANDRSYLFNRTIDNLSFHEARGASDAVMKMVGQLPGPREQLAVLQVGMSFEFARPWTATLKDITVREALDEIAYQLGPSYGWQLSGAQDFRVVTFHEGLLPKPSHRKRGQ